MITLTEKEKETLRLLGTRYKKPEKKKIEYKLPKRATNEIFLSLSNVDDSFSFRGIVPDKK